MDAAIKPDSESISLKGAGNRFAPVAIGATAGTLAYAHVPGVEQIVDFASNGVMHTLETVGGFSETIVNTGANSLGTVMPYAGIAAPFAAPILAGAYLGKKIGNKVSSENKVAQWGWSAAGATLGGLAVSTVAMPYIIGAAATGASIELGVKGAKMAYSAFKNRKKSTKSPSIPESTNLGTDTRNDTNDGDSGGED